MRSVFYVLSAFAVIGLAMWAYSQNDKTQRAINDLRNLRHEIRSLHEAISVQRAEWAYLNRPERLEALVDMNMSRLGLTPLTGQQFGQIGEIAYPLLLETPRDRP